MTIPDDPLRRQWYEAAAAPENAERVRNHAGGLVAFLAFGRDREPQFAGTGFVIGQHDSGAIVLTAKHVLTEGVVNVQTPHRMHAPSALTQFVERESPPRLGNDRLLAVWSNHTGWQMLSVIYVGNTDNHDLACCLLVSKTPATFKPVTFPLDTLFPAVGSKVTMVSLDGLDCTEVIAPKDRTGHGQRLTMHRRVSMRVGTVTGVHPSGYRQYRWPCFTTSIPATEGMSGGLVYVQSVLGEPTSAAGVVCADCSPGDVTDYRVAGESIVGCTWPAMGLHMMTERTADGVASYQTLRAIAGSSLMPLPRGGIEHISVDVKGDSVPGSKVTVSYNRDLGER